MKLTILKIDQYKLGLIMGIITAAVSLLVWPFFLIMFSSQDINLFAESPWVYVSILLLPLFHFAFASIGTIIFFSIFNFVARKIKGFEIEMAEPLPVE